MPEGLSWATPRPIDETYWVVPGRLLVGEHPGSRSRAQALDRVRRFVAAGITCFIDLTEPDETPQYEPLLPVKSPSGVAVKYVREPITDHGVPAGVEQMARIVGSIDDALADGHNIYLHCRAGIGRSALAVGCWLAEKRGSTAAAEAELAELWQQAAQSSFWARIPETDAQVEYLRRWLGPGAQPTLAAAPGKNQTESGTAEGCAAHGTASHSATHSAPHRRAATALRQGRRGPSQPRWRFASRTACSNCSASMRATRSSVMRAGNAKAIVRRMQHRASDTPRRT
jgi:hypothetical protein